MPILDQEQRRIIEAGYKNGLVLREIARAAGITPKCARYNAAKMGLQHPRSPTRANKTDDLPEANARYQNWQRARNGAAATLKALEGDRA